MPLPAPWTVWIHRATDKDWSEASYTQLLTTTDVDELWGCLLAVQRHFDDAMFFVMREGVPPLWEHPANVDGGCFSLRVPCGGQAWGEFESLVAHAVTGAWGAGAQGVSNSCKGRFQVLKLWCRSCENPKVHLRAARFMPNREKC